MVPEVEKLEELRKELDYSQEDVARLMDISWATYANWVYKDTEPNYKSIKKIMEWTDKLEDRLKGKKVPTKNDLGEMKKSEESDNYEVYET